MTDAPTPALTRILEAILFVTEAPVTTVELAEVTEHSPSDVEAALTAIGDHLGAEHGFELRSVSGGWRLYTSPDALDYVERFASTDTSRKLSKAAIETLAVVAYRQPVSRGQVSEIRGVDSEHSLRTLERRELIHEIGRAPGPGQAVLYGTTGMFLEKMGLSSLSELPPLADHVPPAQIMETLEMPLRTDAPSNDSTS